MLRRLLLHCAIAGLLCGCPHPAPPPTAPTVSAEDVAGVFDASASLLEHGHAQTPTACAGMRGSAAALRLAAASVRIRADAPELPGFALPDLGACLVLREDDITGDAAETVALAVSDALQLVRAFVALAPLDCRARAWTDASAAYLAGAAGPIAAFIADPAAEPQLVPGQPVNLTQCGD